MGEEMELSNGGFAQDGAEMVPMTTASTTQGDNPTKLPPLHLHKLRNLAIASIICGCSCIGVLALIYAIKASEKQKAGSQDVAAYWARKSRLMSVFSIAVWLCLLILVPLLVILVSYIFAQAE
ncbi:hypothetical protein EYD10_14450 [Varanus komodoensis]|uniref:transmembrane protein 265 n=1 Tax=Varanus komodoensis TaxID=61221 RepID=UPI001CF780D8|nr:transmembrane protein 265 [Varanus komodoensis]KAF7238750.1 hypothetical protein EYD10_14450 [Varanus komodoensis]